MKYWYEFNYDNGKVVEQKYVDSDFIKSTRKYIKENKINVVITKKGK